MRGTWAGRRTTTNPKTDPYEIDDETRHNRAAGIMAAFDALPPKTRERINAGVPLTQRQKTQKFYRYVEAHNPQNWAKKLEKNFGQK